MKRVSVDANIFIDLLCERHPWFPQVMRIFNMGDCLQIELYCSSLSFGTVSPTNSATFARGNESTVSNCYYTQTLGTEQGEEGILLFDSGVTATANAGVISRNNGKQYTVKLQGRTLYKDGDWNTLCLPFDVTVGSDQMSGATAMTLNGEDSGLSGTTLTHSYMEWAAGTEYKSILLLGANSKLFWPNGEKASKLGACRAYFELSDGVSAREFVLNFGEETSSMHNAQCTMHNAQCTMHNAQCTMHNAQCTMHNEAGAWYTLDGRKLDGKPRKAGLYIHGGRTFVVK